MHSFRTTNILIGWGLFAIALTVYTCTLEPTASFWDCSEYIAAAYKLEITHPPGAPLFQLVGKIFSFLAGNNLQRVAFWANLSAAIASSATVMVVFWILSLLGRKAMGKSSQTLQPSEAWGIWLAAIVGALCLLFGSTFWSNATETETYALSTLLMCLTLWGMLNWEASSLSAQSYRWLLLVTYIVGLSLGTRMFSLLMLPGLALLYYFKKNTTINARGVVLAILAGLLLVGFLYAGIILGTPSLIMAIERFCVNTLGLPFQSGMVVLLLSIGIPLGYMIGKTARKHATLHGILLGLFLIGIGYSTYLLVPIRAQANPPINEGNPCNLVAFTNYLKREQYGNRPLLYGPHFGAQVIGAKRTIPIYQPKDRKYVIVGYRHEPIFRPDSYVLFPRTWSQQSPLHVQIYQHVLGLKAWQKPDFFDQLRFFLSYQLPHFYLRYFFWNFSGRASDLKDASWLTPLSVFEKAPIAISKSPGRHNYYALPLLLGLLGIALQYKRDKRSLAILTSFFLMLGVALLVFLNPPPIEPRERDYIYIGSFIIFTLWIGLGALWVIETSKKFTKHIKHAWLLGGIGCLVVPILMAAQGWHTHDRSKRYFAVETAKNLLASCAPNAILFTAGDNDTFPLWYVQEVEKFRTDVRVIVLSYANAGWYIQQLFRTVNESKPLPLSLPSDDYQTYGLNDFLPYVPQPTVTTPLNLAAYLDLIRTHHPALQIRNTFGEVSNSLPCQEIELAIHPTDIQKKGIVPAAYTHLTPSRLSWKVTGRGLEKRDLLLLDLIATTQWERPIYFNHSSIQGFNLDLKSHVVTEGLALRLLPIENTQQHELVNIPATYELLMQNFHGKGLDQPGVYYDDNYRLVFIRNHRMAFHSLAKALIKTGQHQQAESILLRCLTLFPDEVVAYDVATASLLPLLFSVGNHEKALSVITVLGERAQAILSYKKDKGLPHTRETEEYMATLYEIVKSLYKAGYGEKAIPYQNFLEQYTGQPLPLIHQDSAVSR